MSTPAAEQDARSFFVDANFTTAASFTTPGIKCGLGTLAPASSHTVVDLRPTAARRLELAGNVSEAEHDRAPADNTNLAAITVGLATVDVIATAQPPQLIAGSANRRYATTRGMRLAYLCTGITSVVPWLDRGPTRVTGKTCGDPIRGPLPARQAACRAMRL
jgi:hypothetical protein